MQVDKTETAESRFVENLAVLAPEWGKNDTKLLIALSGGADSCALLHLASSAFPGRVHAMTVDHGLRPEAADEARYCAALCKCLSVPHAIGTIAATISGNIQSEARKLRYDLLQEEADRLGGALIATAHHADDQLETILMRLARGSGVSGLAAIRGRNGKIIRPLLSFAKSELIEICRAADIEWIEDPSNHNADFDRVRMRKALAGADLPIAPHALCRTTKALNDAEDALNFAAHNLAKERIERTETGWRLAPSDIPHELLRRIILILLIDAGESQPRGEVLERAILALKNKQKISLGHLNATGGHYWHFTVAPPRKG